MYRPPSLKPKLEIVPRDKWKALPPTETRENIHKPIRNVIIWFIKTMEPCTTDEACENNMRTQQHKDMSRTMSDIKYNFVIGGNAKVYEGRGWGVESSRRLAYCQLISDRLDIAHFGPFKRLDQLDMKVKLIQEELIQQGVDQGFIEENFKLMHKDH